MNEGVTMTQRVFYQRPIFQIGLLFFVFAAALLARLYHITENYTSDQMMGLYKKEINLLEQITETL